ncbi:AlpA family phage regulatory protein [Sphingomonas sp. 1P08PE]|uniref:AlpA family phage regulatory protein n=1 Tax=Sphingomonas sp. 1P08PE TaxID=554122 RepID=UPI0039A27CF3
MKLIGIKDVMFMTGFSRSHIYSQIKVCRFPRQQRYGKRAVRWFEEEVKLWAVNPIEWHISDWRKR